jgi:hypothetical protein
MDALIEFKTPRSSTPHDESITWQPEDAPVHHLAQVMRALTPTIVGDGYEHLLGLFDARLGMLRDDAEIQAGIGYVVIATWDFDPRGVFIVHEYEPEVGLALGAPSMLECIKAVRRAYWHRTPQYVQVQITAIDLEQLPDVRDGLLWAQW